MTDKQFKRNVDRSKLPGKRKSSLWVRRELIRLTAALLIFGGCMIGKNYVPAIQDRLTPMLQNLLSCSCDFEEAVRCFSTQLESGSDVGDALEEFCVTAFAAQTSQQDVNSNPERVALMNTLSYSGTLTNGY